MNGHFKLKMSVDQHSWELHSFTYKGLTYSFFTPTLSPSSVYVALTHFAPTENEMWRLATILWRPALSPGSMFFLSRMYNCFDDIWLVFVHYYLQKHPDKSQTCLSTRTTGQDRQRSQSLSFLRVKIYQPSGFQYMRKPKKQAPKAPSYASWKLRLTDSQGWSVELLA